MPITDLILFVLRLRLPCLKYAYHIAFPPCFHPMPFRILRTLGEYFDRHHIQGPPLNHFPSSYLRSIDLREIKKPERQGVDSISQLYLMLRIYQALKALCCPLPDLGPNLLYWVLACTRATFKSAISLHDFQQITYLRCFRKAGSKE